MHGILSDLPSDEKRCPCGCGRNTAADDTQFSCQRDTPVPHDAEGVIDLIDYLEDPFHAA